MLCRAKGQQLEIAQGMTAYYLTKVSTCVCVCFHQVNKLWKGILVQTVCNILQKVCLMNTVVHFYICMYYVYVMFTVYILFLQRMNIEFIVYHTYAMHAYG